MELKNLFKYMAFFLLGFFSCWAIAVMQEKPVSEVIYKLTSPDETPASQWLIHAVYTFSETYPQLKQASEEILADDFVSMSEGAAFRVLLNQAQDQEDLRREAFRAAEINAIRAVKNKLQGSGDVR